jgi:AMP deaminase
VTYDANTDTMTPAAPALEYSAPKPAAPPGEHAASFAAPRKGPAGEGLSKAQTWAAPAVVADPHLSGDDPKMFPGVLTRGRRKNSLRNLTAAEDSTKTGNDSARTDGK